jgi:hypothetical protein
MDDQELRPKPKRTRKRRSRAEPAPMVDAGLPAEPTPTPVAAGEDDLGLPLQWALFDTGAADLVPAVAADVDAELPIPAPVPLRPVRRSWAIRLGLLRQDFTAEALGPRRMLLRDTSGMLIVVALLGLMASQLPIPPAADGGGDAVPSGGAGGGLLLPRGTLDLFSATPEATPSPGQTPSPTIDITQATVPPWLLPTPTPTASPRPTTAPTAGPTAKPKPTATPKPTPTPVPTPVPPPAPVITSGPADGDTSATFLFEDADHHVTFACKLDTGGYKPSSSGVTYTVAAGSGTHRFWVTAIDDAGTSSSATQWKWTV